MRHAIRAGVFGCCAFLCVIAHAQAPRVSVLVDLDPQRVDRSTQIESIAADSAGRLYVADNVSGNVLRVDPKSPVPVVVGRILRRETQGMGASNGLAFNKDGDLFIAKGAFTEVLRIRKDDLDPNRPGAAETFATAVANANGLIVLPSGHLLVSGSASGNIYRIPPQGGTAQVVFHRDQFFPNGLTLDANGRLYVSDTQRGEIWRFAVNATGTIDTATLFVKNALLERVDGIAFDGAGTLWCAVQSNSIVTVTPDGTVRLVAHNDSRGPLEVPTAIVFVGSRAYTNNHDTVAPPNGDGKMSDGGVGASILVIDP